MSSRSHRPITSYARVQSWIGNLIRCKRLQLRRQRIRNLSYLDLGCGPNTHDGYINVDFLWHPGVDVCWDIASSIPFRSGSMRGIFTEHCLEHFSLQVAASILAECRRILAPGGTLRIVVPDGEAYLRTYCLQIDGVEGARFPFHEQEDFGGIRSPILSVNRVFYQDRDSPSGHRAMFDFHLLALLLHRSGLSSVSRRSFGEGADEVLLIDSAARAEESLYVEASVSGES